MYTECYTCTWHWRRDVYWKGSQRLHFYHVSVFETKQVLHRKWGPLQALSSPMSTGSLPRLVELNEDQSVARCTSKHPFQWRKLMARETEGWRSSFHPLLGWLKKKKSDNHNFIETHSIPILPSGWGFLSTYLFTSLNIQSRRGTFFLKWNNPWCHAEEQSPNLKLKYLPKFRWRTRKKTTGVQEGSGAAKISTRKNKRQETTEDTSEYEYSFHTKVSFTDLWVTWSSRNFSGKFQLLKSWELCCNVESCHWEERLPCRELHKFLEWILEYASPN